MNTCQVLTSRLRVYNRSLLRRRIEVDNVINSCKNQERLYYVKDKAFLTLSVLFFLTFFIGIITVSLQKPLMQTLKASSVNPSPLKSFGIVFPQIGKIGDENSEDNKPTQVKVTIVLRDVNGVSLPNRSVKLVTSLSSVNIKPSNLQTTNEIGQAIFNLTSDNPGTAQVQATDVVSNSTVANIPTVEFTE